MSREDERHLGTADLIRAGDRHDAERAAEVDPHVHDDTHVHVDSRQRGDGHLHGDSVNAATPLHGESAMQREDAMRREEAMRRGPQAGATGMAGMPSHAQHQEPLAALFQGDVAEGFRHRWDAIQIGFVDDPRAAVRSADELVAQVMKSLAETFAQQRSEMEMRLGEGNQADTENLRVALQRYRSFFQRLLSL